MKLLGRVIFRETGSNPVNGADFELHERARESELVEKEWTPLEPGTRWECLRCSWCCRQPWAVNLTWWEFERLENDDRASDLRVDRVEVDQGTGLTHPYFVIDGKCPALDDGTSLCTLYPDWPYTCATYPFLLMPDGRLLVHMECEGFGHGEVIDRNRMRERILRERRRAGMRI